MKLKHRKSTRVAPDPPPVRLPLSLIVDGHARDLAKLSTDEKKALVSLRAYGPPGEPHRGMRRATYRHPEFDERRLLDLRSDAAAVADWHARRLAYLREYFRDHPQVDIDA